MKTNIAIDRKQLHFAVSIGLSLFVHAHAYSYGRNAVALKLRPIFGYFQKVQVPDSV